MARFKVVALIGVFALLIGVVWIGPPSTASAQVSHHVTNATELHLALDAAESNGEDDIIYLAAGTYEGNFIYNPPVTEQRSLTITGESGTSAADIILDGRGSGRTLHLYEWEAGPVAEVRVNGITVQNGNSTHSGGGIYAALANYDIYITNCIVRNNTAERYGGGIYMDTSHNLTLENNLILNNTIIEDDAGVSRGGGVAMIAVGHEYTIRNNIIAGNSAQGTDAQGAGLWVGWTGNDIIHLVGNTIADNQAVAGCFGGGVYFHRGDTANVYNNIIYGNSATDGDDVYFHDVTNRIGYHNDYTELYGNWTDYGGNIDADPLFVDPAAGDYHLQAGSPCIDVGTSDVPPLPGLPATDFDGNDRVIGAAPDIGADEFVPALLDAEFTAHPTAGTAPLTVQFTDQSTGDITSWAWDFDNDGKVDSNEQNPSHTYNTTGSYTVSLNVTDPWGYSLEVLGDYITVSSGGLSVAAIAGIVIGVCAVAGLIAYFVIRRRRAAGKRA
jgi:serine protease